MTRYLQESDNEGPITRIAQVASDLMSYPSVTGAELPVLEHVERLLKGMGWHTERWPISNDERFNVFAALAGKSPTVVLTTHLDVVPAPERLWLPKVEGGALRGRGACDAKGIAAVMIEAADSLRQEGCADVGLLFVVGEETDSVGAKAAVPILRERGIRYIVNGEPTEGKLVVAQKGVLAGTIVIKGKPCHSGYPHLGTDANGFLVELAHALRRIDFGSHPVFGDATLNLGMIRGGSAGNVVSPSAEIAFWIRTVRSSLSSREPIERVVHETAQRFSGIEVGVEVQVVNDPLELEALPHFETTVFCGGSDISYYVESGARVLMFGPGSLHHAHTDDEHVTLQSLEEGYTAYRSICRTIMS